MTVLVMTLRDQLIRDEGCRLKPYKDSEGLLTIGVGRCLDRKGISQTEADFLLDNDLAQHTAEVLASIPCALRISDVRRAVLINMSFNLGTAGLLGFRKFLAAVEAEDYAKAANEMLDSKWRRQVGIRAERLAEQMRTGTWQ